MLGLGCPRGPSGGQDAEHGLSYSRKCIACFGCSPKKKKESCLFAPRGSVYFRNWKQVYLQAPIPNRRMVNINQFLIFNLARAVLLPVVFPRLANDSSTRGEAWLGVADQ